MNLSLRDTILHYTGKEVSADELSKYFALSGNDALKELGIAPVKEANDIWNVTYQKKYAKDIRPFFLVLRSF